MLVPLGLLPVATYLCVAYLVRPAGTAFAPVRLALARAAVLVAGGAVVLVELLSALHALTALVLVVIWSVATVAALGAAVLRYRRAPRPAVVRRIRASWDALGWPERIILVVLAVQILGELLIAVVSPPNNFDSQTYHLPKIEHWVVQRDVAFYPTSIDRQLAMAPGAEYLLLQVRLLTGGDALYNLLQLGAGLACALLASRVAGQFGGSVRAQLLTAFVVGTTPMVALESTSTQTDLVVAAWVAALATLVLDELGRRTRVRDAVLLGAATGLILLTKATGALAAAPLLALWLGFQIRRAVPRALSCGAVVAALAVVVAGPYFARAYAEYHNPLGPPIERDQIAMQRHDPPAVLVNALRIGQTVLQTPVGRVDDAAASGIDHVARALHVDPNDPKITFSQSTFPVRAWLPDEDKAAFPIEAAVVLLGAAVLLVRPGNRNTGMIRGYAVGFWVALLLFVGTVKWQPWGNRLILFLLVLGAPLAGVWLDALLAKARAPATTGSTARGRRAAVVSRGAAWVAALALVASGCAGWLAVGVGWPRRLLGHDSVFVVSDMQARFQRRPQWLADYEWAAAPVRAAGAHRVGLVLGYDTWEYPWWLLLPGDDLVSLRSLQPGIAPARPDSVEAIICVSSAHLCQSFVPAGWSVRMRNGIGYALPAGRP
jgi:hypothetical protein